MSTEYIVDVIQPTFCIYVKRIYSRCDIAYILYICQHEYIVDVI